MTTDSSAETTPPSSSDDDRPPAATTPRPSGAPSTRPKLKVRPTLVVGVGGTGLLAVKALKRRLRELSGGIDIPFISYLSIDTASQNMEGVTLADGEFVNIGAIDYLEIVNRLGDFPHIKAWFPQNAFTSSQLGFGAMGIRHIGRLCYFQGREATLLPILQQRTERLRSAELLDLTNRLLSHLSFQLDQGLGLDIHVIGSGAGGTGSGIFLDLCYDLRFIGGPKSKITGHLVLPDVFEEEISPTMIGLAYNNSNALLSEIDYFSSRRDVRWDVEYKGGRVVFEKTGPCDLTYLLGAKGENGVVRNIQELTEIIGSTIAIFAMTQLGHSLQEAIVNLLPNILNQPDPVAQRPRPYASYGLALGITDEATIAQDTAGDLEQSLLEKVTQSSPATQAQIEAFADDFLRDCGVTMQVLSQKLPSGPAAKLRLHGQNQAHLVKAAVDNHEEEIRTEVRDGEKAWSQHIAGVLAGCTSSRLVTRAAELFRGQDEFKLGVADLVTFVRTVGKKLKELSDLSRKDTLSNASLEAAAMAVKSKAREDLGAKGSLESASEQCDRAMIHRVYFQGLHEQISQVVNSVEPAATTILLDFQRAFPRPGATGTGVPAATVRPPRVRLFDASAVLATLDLNLEEAEKDYRDDLTVALSRGEPIDRRNFRPKAMARAQAEEIVRRAMHTFCTNGRLDPTILAGKIRETDPGHLQTRMEVYYKYAQPAIKTVEKLPREQITILARVGAGRDSAICRQLQEHDPRLQGKHDPAPDLALARFHFGLPLWAIVGTETWEKAAIDIQISQAVAHNFLDPRWARVIPSYTLMAREHRDEVWMFTMLSCLKKITHHDRSHDLGVFTFFWNGANLFDRAAPQHVSQAFEEFRRLLRLEMLTFADIKPAVERELRELGPVQRVCAELERYCDELGGKQNIMVKGIGDIYGEEAVAFRRDIQLIRDEMLVLTEEVRLRRLRGRL